jgi:predicted DNA-binding protein
MAAKSDTADQTSPGTVYIGFRAPGELAERFEEIAKENERTTSAELRLLMKQHIEAAA